MTYDGIHHYSFDAEGNILSVDNGGTATYVYDANNRRINVTTGSGTYDYVYDFMGRRTSEWSPTLGHVGTPLGGRVYWGSQPQQVAFISGSGATFFDHQDYLGTERMRTDYNGAIAATYLSGPWGDGYIANVNETAADQDSLHFADLDFDKESGTEHAQFRNYSSAQGRWIGTDPYDGSYDVTNPQSFNRYIYALNNPLSFVDPSGLDDCQGTEGGYEGCGPGGCNYSDACGGDPNPQPDPPNDPCAGADACVVDNPTPRPDPDPSSPYFPGIPYSGYQPYPYAFSGGSAPNNPAQPTSGSCSVNRALAAVPGAAPTNVNTPVDGHLEVGISVSEATLINAGFQYYAGPFGPNGYRLGT